MPAGLAQGEEGGALTASSRVTSADISAMIELFEDASVRLELGRELRVDGDVKQYSVSNNRLAVSKLWCVRPPPRIGGRGLCCSEPPASPPTACHTGAFVRVELEGKAAVAAEGRADVLQWAWC